MKITEERLRSVVENVANKLELKEWSYIQDNIDGVGDNYFGVLVPVKLFGVGKEGQVQKSVFIKFGPSDAAIGLRSIIRQHYEVEIYTYCQLIPIYKRLCNVDILKIIPDCYYADLEANNEVLALQDMRCEGFKLFEGNRFLDSDHIKLSLETLAKFHSLSIFLKEKGTDFDNIIMQPYTDKHVEPYFIYIKDALTKHINLFDNTIYEKYYKRLASDLADFVNNAASKVNYLIYGHGDFWKENILFKYENSKPIQACVLDYQKSRKMSPAQDILSFLLTNIEHIDIVQHAEYLNTYLESLHRTLVENCVECVYTADDLKHDMKIVAPYCSAITIMGLSLWFGLQRGCIVESKHKSSNPEKDLMMFKTTVMAKMDQLHNYGYISLE